MPGRTLPVYSLTLLLGCLLLIPAPATNDSPPKEVPTGKSVESAFLVEPYLQLPTTTSMTIMWETNLKLPSTVEYGTTRELGQTVVAKSPVVLHEVGHGLGFFSEIDGGTCIGGSTPGAECGRNADCPGGTCDLSTLGTWLNGFPGVYDLFLVRPAATPPRFTDMTDAQRKSASTSGSVFWDGANVVAAHGGNGKIFAPNPLQPGSSISHWDTSLTPDELHEPFYTGPNHNPGLSLNAFADEGWTVGPTTTTSSSTTTTTTIPFGGDDTGCVPDSKDHLKCGDAIGKAFGNAIRAVIKCHKKQADDRFNGVSDTITGPAEDLCANGPNGGRSAKEKLDAAIGKVSFLCSASQLAAAATQESTLFAGQTNAASLDAQNGDVYCEAGTAIDPSGDDAGQIPSTKDRLTCADTVDRSSASSRRRSSSATRSRRTRCSPGRPSTRTRARSSIP